MNGTIPAGRVFGIPVRVTPGWFVAVAGSTALLALKIYPELLPERPAGVHWSLGLATSLLFFISVLLHELGHALIARRCGVPVKSITLFLLGGVAQIAHDVRRPSREALIAFAGPAVSLLLAGAFLAPALIIRRREPLLVLCGWVGLMNLSVGVFNLLPGFPMDGGRLFRALAWGLTGRYGLATRLAAWSGRVLAWGMVAVGLLMVLRLDLFGRYGEPLGGFWLAMLGFYLDSAARQSLLALRVLEELGRFSAADLMLRDVPVVDAADSVLDFMPALLAVRDCEAAFVAEHDADESEPARMIGMVLRGMAVRVPQRDWGLVKASDLMLPATDMHPAAIEDDGASLLQRLEGEGLVVLPVVASGEVVGIIGRAGLLRRIEHRGRA